MEGEGSAVPTDEEENTLMDLFPARGEETEAAGKSSAKIRQVITSDRLPLLQGLAAVCFLKDLATLFRVCALSARIQTSAGTSALFRYQSQHDIDHMAIQEVR